MRIFLFLLVFFTSTPAAAYSKYGHVAICELAYRELTDTARAEVNRLLAIPLRRDGFNHSSYNRSCLDADEFPRTRGSEHFLNVSRDTKSISDGSCGAASKCVLSAIDQDLAILSDGSSDDIQKSLSLRHLGHWVGDVHQPLHISYKDDRGGNQIKKRGRCRARNLHAVWDNCIVERKVFDFGFFSERLGFQRFTKVYRAVDRIEGEILDKDRANWIDSDVWQWADESYKIAISESVGYCHNRNEACWYDTSNKILDVVESERVIQIDDNYLERHKPVVELRLKQAGVRLAHLINSALDSAYDPITIEGD